MWGNAKNQVRNLGCSHLLNNEGLFLETEHLSILLMCASTFSLNISPNLSGTKCSYFGSTLNPLFFSSFPLLRKAYPFVRVYFGVTVPTVKILECFHTA